MSLLISYVLIVAMYDQIYPSVAEPKFTMIIAQTLSDSIDMATYEFTWSNHRQIHSLGKIQIVKKLAKFRSTPFRNKRAYLEHFVSCIGEKNAKPTAAMASLRICITPFQSK